MHSYCTACIRTCICTYIPKGYIHGFFLTSLCSSQGILGQSGVEGDPGEPGAIVSFSYKLKDSRVRSFLEISSLVVCSSIAGCMHCMHRAQGNMYKIVCLHSLVSVHDNVQVASNFYKSECLVETSSTSTTCTRSCCLHMAVPMLQGTAGASGDDGFQGPRGAPVSALLFSPL